MKAGIILFLSILVCNTGFCQESDPSHDRWYINFSAGYLNQDADFVQKSVADYLITSNEATGYGKFLSSSYYFPFKLGLEFGLVANFHEHGGSTDVFRTMVKREYGDDYFVDFNPPYRYNEGSSEASASVFVGLSYKFETNRWIFIPRVQYGYSSFQAQDATVILKERGSNQIEEESYKAAEGDDGFSSWTPGAFIGYRLFGSVLVGLEARYNQYDCDLNYEIERKNLYSGETSTQIVDYSQEIRNYYLGIEVKVDIIRLVHNM